MTPKPELEGKLNALSFSNHMVLVEFEDGSRCEFRHAFARREGDWWAVYTEHCGYHLFLAVSVESLSEWQVKPRKAPRGRTKVKT